MTRDSTGATRTLRFASWNIQGIREKCNDSSFLSSINKFDVVGLVETWVDRHIKVDGYYSVNKYRKRNKRINRVFGGIALYIKNKLRKGIEEINTMSDFVLAIKLKKDYFSLTKDIIVCEVYIPPEGSSYWNNHPNRCPFDEIDSFLSIYANSDIVLMGDLNARVASKLDYITNDDTAGLSGRDAYIPDIQLTDRVSTDTIVNKYGRRLLETCKENKIRFLNGRVLGDLTGSFTCHQRNGSSVVDYILVNENMIQNVSMFKVHDVSPISDHCMVSMVLRVKLKTMVQCVSSTIKEIKIDYVWESNSKEAYVQALNSPMINNMLKNIISDCANPENTENNIDRFVHKVSEVLEKAADISLRKKPGRRNGPKKVRRKWQCKDCDAIRRSIQWLGKLLNKYPKDPFIRGQLYAQRKAYKVLVKKKNKEYVNRMLQNIYCLEKYNPKGYWSIVNKLRKQKADQSPIDIETWTAYFKELHRWTSTEQFDKVFERKIVEKLKAIRANDPSENVIFDRSIGEKEIIDACRKLKNGKATGIDAISNEMLKASLDLLLPVYKQLFNKILTSGEYPENWAVGLIVPVHKGGRQKTQLTTEVLVY